ncbi:hypothetical protein QVD17_06742 [Tagetes erecta]|uniref:Sieve element occlusion N-terminal domain-containing protein n=1 Tax=Tagetes erecta TaxID=13708 RepID=A0AAD8LES4_TARER|nr:hypothetical protein QVD17_06742 [Tagetes erecta]
MRKLDTHKPDGTEVNVTPLMQMVEDLLQDITNTNGESTSLMLINLLSNTDGHPIVLSLFHVVENFHWEATLALILATFDLAYSPNQLENSMDILEQLSTITDEYNAISKHIHSILDLSRSTFQFKELPSIISSEVPVAVYLNVRGIVACAAHITSIGYEYGTSPAKIQSSELSYLFLNINSKLMFLSKQLEEYNRVIGQTRSSKENIVLLLISGLDMEEVSVLEQIYIESLSHRARPRYNMVWIPIVDPHIMNIDALKARFEEMRNNMSWYSFYNPSNVDKAVKRSIRDVWHFMNKPILVVLDQHGRQVSPNALHMMWIWGSIAFPFTTAREEAL